ncbi:calreticulin-3 [Anaeramoeba flamelloides]|uniref:Calreticulin-3 n=1 Tax=Anaeramoeba flamelloides TaxID=1746091 RepID=A0AAV7Z6I1_9EUKA|nr:calreticulin-3 [Anaeramoeba flamelloides]
MSMFGFCFECAFVFFLLLSFALSNVYFQETFDQDWKERWTIPNEDLGEWQYTTGPYYGSPELNHGIQTTSDKKHYLISSKFQKPLKTTLNKTLVIQYSYRNVQKLKCGGTYFKLFDTNFSPENFSAEDQYLIMFGPDECGVNGTPLHIILNYRGNYYKWRKNANFKIGERTKIYTLVFNPNNTYQVYIDMEMIDSGEIFHDFGVYTTKTISKIFSNERDSEIYFTENTEHENNSESESESETETESETESEGNSKEEIEILFEEAEQIDNPKYVSPNELHVFENLDYLGIDIFQVESGTIFDSFLICDNFTYAMEFANLVWKNQKKNEEKRWFIHHQEQQKLLQQQTYQIHLDQYTRDVERLEQNYESMFKLADQIFQDRKIVDEKKQQLQQLEDKSKIIQKRKKKDKEMLDQEISLLNNQLLDLNNTLEIKCREIYLKARKYLGTDFRIVKDGTKRIKIKELYERVDSLKISKKKLDKIYQQIKDIYEGGMEWRNKKYFERQKEKKQKEKKQMKNKEFQINSKKEL